MVQDLKYLPPNYRQLISNELGCSREMVREVKKQIEQNNSVLLTSKLQIKILKSLKKHIDEAKQVQALLAS